MSSKLPVATVGAGYFSQFHYDAWKRLEADLVAICDRDTDRARATAQKYDVAQVFSNVNEMLAETDPQLLDIITPPAGHLDCIEGAAACGVDVICQKPFTRSLTEARQAADLARAAGTLLVVHENFRFQPWYAEIKHQLDEGRIGEPYQMTFRLRPGDGQGPEAYLDRQPYFQKQERFLVNETAVHLVDVFRYLFGEVETVWADLKKLNPVIAGEDAGIIMLNFKNGRRALFDGNRLVDHAAENRRLTMGEMLVEGSGGVLTLDGDGRLFFRKHDSNYETEIDYVWEDRAYAGDCVYRLQRHVLEHIQTGTAVHNTAAEYLQNLQIVEAIYESDRSKQQLRIF